MKRKITITLTIAGLLGLAGILYGTGNPTFFSNVHNPDPPPHQAGPIGVAAAPADLIATEYCSFTGFTNVDKVDCFGGFATIAMIPTPGGGGCEELYMTIAPTQAANAGFTPRDYFITAGPNIYQLRLPNPPTLFAVIPDSGCSPDHTGITFDKEGQFGNDMLVTCKFSGGVWKVDGTGAVTNVGNFHSAGQIGEIESPAVVPRGFGPFGGQLWVSDEDYTNTSTTAPGAVHAMDSGGNATLDVVEWHGAEGVHVIPDNPCFFCSGGEFFQAITLNEQGPIGLYQEFPADFTNLGGNVLVPSESSDGTALVQFNGTNYVTSSFDNIPGGTFEGASFVDCDVPTPTPTATSTPAATATFTPIATATFTPTPMATSTSTPTPTPTPSATCIQVSQITPPGTTCTQFKNCTADTLSSVNYSLDYHGRIHSVSPGAFFYWVRLTASAGSNTFTITQTITTGNFNTFFGIQAGSNVFDSNCNSLQPTITQNGNTTTVTFNAPAAGTYFISINYDPHSVVGQPAPSPGTTVHYDFTTTGVPGSTSGLDLVKQ